MLIVSRYQDKEKNEWDAFIARAKNGHFMFYRDYMEYHSDKFNDFSLIARDKAENIVAVLPANQCGETIVSHQGLTFGGIILGCEVSAVQVVDILQNILEFIRNNKFEKLLYKRIPDIYSRFPAQEDRYALFLQGASLIRCDLNSTIDLSTQFTYSKGRKWSINKARKYKLFVCESNDFSKYWNILAQTLAKHGAFPTHTLAEITYLKKKFPNNLRLFGAWRDATLLAGTLVYINREVVHTQYMATTDEGKAVGALDFCIDTLVKDVFREKKFFDFGISTEDNGKYLNEGLLRQKEGFGARGTVHEFYELNLK